jgi:hypothetical protein
MCYVWIAHKFDPQQVPPNYLITLCSVKNASRGFVRNMLKAGPGATCSADDLEKCAKSLQLILRDCSKLSLSMVMVPGWIQLSNIWDDASMVQVKAMAGTLACGESPEARSRYGQDTTCRPGRCEGEGEDAGVVYTQISLYRYEKQ